MAYDVSGAARDQHDLTLAQPLQDFETFPIVDSDSDLSTNGFFSAGFAGHHEVLAVFGSYGLGRDQ